jgi:hypothetical protein
MFKFSYKYSNHIDYLRDLANFAGVPIINGVILLPPGIGSGYIKAVELTDGLQVLINECVINQDVHFFRQPSMEESYTLRFDEVKNLKSLTIQN